jgi:GH24 family phage-related lysozyme (muramidase)
MAIVERNPFSVIPGGGTDAGQPPIKETDVEIEMDDPETSALAEELLGYEEDNVDITEEQEDHYANIADFLSDEDLEEIGSEVVEAYEADKESRAEWESTFERGFDLLGLKLQETTEPFEGSCTAVSPLIIESAVKFQSKATIELFPSSGPVRTQVVGDVTPEREQQAQRVQDFMNYQFTEQITEYFDEFEKMLFHLPLIGSAFKKMYYDPMMMRPCSEFVPIDQFYVSYHAADLTRAERYTHVIHRTPNEMDRDIFSGMYRDADLAEATSPDPDSFTSKIDSIMGISPAENYDLQYVLLEQHCYLDLPEPFNSPNEVSLPYVVTVEEESRKVIAIRRNWSKEDPTQTKQTYFTHYKFVPGFGFYGLGLIHLLGNMTMSATSALRSLVDAGQFSNLPGGFKARGVRVVGGNDPIAPGEFREVEATGLDLQKSIVPLPYKEPSQTLYNMLNWLTEAGQKFADSTEQVVNEASNYGPVGTTMALIESSAKFFSAIHKRLHKSQHDEFRILAKINFEFLPDEYPYDVPNVTSSVFKSDFDGRVDVIPVSDPNVPSAAHRLSMAQMVLQLSSQAPQGMYNLEQVHISILKAANVQHPERFFTPQQPPEPHDPLTDIQLVVKGMPIQAFPQQDHPAHIAIKTAFIEDPTMGQNELMAPAVPVLQANIQQHMVMEYQEQISGVVNVELSQAQQQGEQVSPEVLSRLSIDAADKVLKANQMYNKTGGSIEEQHYELETARLDLEQQKMQLSATKDAADLAIQNRELDIKEMDIKLEAATKVSEKNQKQMDARVREDDSIRGTKTKIVVESLKNMMKERELMVKKREQEHRYAEGGPVNYAQGDIVEDIRTWAESASSQFGIPVDEVFKTALHPDLYGGVSNSVQPTESKLTNVQSNVPLMEDDMEKKLDIEDPEGLAPFIEEDDDMIKKLDVEDPEGLAPYKGITQAKGMSKEEAERRAMSDDPSELYKYQQKGPPTVTTTNATETIKKFEDFRKSPYPDTGGKHARGYGFTTDSKGKDIKADSGDMTQEQADTELEKRVGDLRKQIKQQAKKDGVPELSESKVEALISLSFNVGPSAVFGSDGWKALKRGDWDKASYEFFDENAGFTKADGKKLAGLVRRRNEERNLFFS